MVQLAAAVQRRGPVLAGGRARGILLDDSGSSRYLAMMMPRSCDDNSSEERCPSLGRAQKRETRVVWASIPPSPKRDWAPGTRALEEVRATATATTARHSGYVSCRPYGIRSCKQGQETLAASFVSAYVIGMGRPPRNQTAAKHVIQVRVTDAEKKILNAKRLPRESVHQATRRLALERCEATA